MWHDHKDTDEVLIVFEGEMAIHFRDRDVSVKKGELFVIPKGVEHKTSALIQAEIILLTNRAVLLILPPTEIKLWVRQAKSGEIDLFDSSPE